MYCMMATRLCTARQYRTVHIRLDSTIWFGLPLWPHAESQKACPQHGPWRACLLHCRHHRGRGRKGNRCLFESCTRSLTAKQHGPLQYTLTGPTNSFSACFRECTFDDPGIKATESPQSLPSHAMRKTTSWARPLATENVVLLLCVCNAGADTRPWRTAWCKRDHIDVSIDRVCVLGVPSHLSCVPSHVKTEVLGTEWLA